MSKPNIIPKGEGSFESFVTRLPSASAAPIVSAKKKAITSKADALAQALEQARQQAYQEGLLKGIEEGRQQGVALGFEQAHGEAQIAFQAELEAFKGELNSVVSRVESAMTGWYQASEEELSKLAIEIATCVIRTELRTNPDSVLGMVKDALGEVTHSSQARIRVNPFDSKILATKVDELMSCSASVRGIKIVDDPSLLGGCIIETDGGVIDASVDGQIQALKDQYGSAA